MTDTVQWPFSQIVDQMRPDQYNKHIVKCYNFRMQIANANSEEWMNSKNGNSESN